jgi:hypothetical protein
LILFDASINPCNIVLILSLSLISSFTGFGLYCHVLFTINTPLDQVVHPLTSVIFSAHPITSAIQNKTPVGVAADSGFDLLF